MSGLVSIWIAAGAISGLIGWAIGRSKGRGGAGFTLGFFLGFIGWIIVAVMEPTASVRRERQIEAATAVSQALGPDPAIATRTCPYCAETIKAAATVCRFCNREVKASLPSVDRWAKHPRSNVGDLWNALYTNISQFERTQRQLEALLDEAGLTAAQLSGEQCELVASSAWATHRDPLPSDAVESLANELAAVSQY